MEVVVNISEGFVFFFCLGTRYFQSPFVREKYQKLNSDNLSHQCCYRFH